MRLVLKGRKVDPDGMKKLASLAAVGDSDAMFSLAEAYADSRRYGMAMVWWNSAADAGNVAAMVKIADSHCNGKNGARKDYPKAFELYSKAANAGNSDAMYGLGCMYLAGNGVKADEIAARKWFEKSSDLNNAKGMLGLGHMYENGYGVIKNCSNAVKWYRKAADVGNAQAAYRLYRMYYSGKGEVGKSESEAEMWKQKAIANDNDGSVGRKIAFYRFLHALFWPFKFIFMVIYAILCGVFVILRGIVLFFARYPDVLMWILIIGGGILLFRACNACVNSLR